MSLNVDQLVENSLVKTTIIMEFAQPASLNVPVIGTESEFGTDKFTLLQSNIITDITNAIDPAAGLLFQLFTKRLNFDTLFLGTSAQYLTTFNAKKRPGFYKGLKKGSFNFTEIQIAGAPAVQDYLVTTVRPLIT